MKINKNVILGAVAAVVATLGVSASAIAATTPSSTASDNPESALVQKIADKFHLSKSDVQKVFDEEQAAHQQQRQQNLEDRLNQAVKDGKLTDAQKDQLLDELKKLHGQLKSENHADRHQNRQAIHDQLEQWAKDNGIDLSQVLPAPPQDHGPMN